MVRTGATMMMVAALGCSTQQPAKEPVLSGDTCGLHVAATACQADADCRWLGTGCACPPNDPSCQCSPGTCVAATDSSADAACACPGGGVCFEQVGGPVQDADADPVIACAPASPSSGDDPCAEIEGEGTCEASATVHGLCLCDNGER